MLQVMLFHFKFSGALYFYFLHLSIDGTLYDHRQGPFVNDSSVPNAVMKKIVVDSKPRLCLFALKDIGIGDELRYSYEDEGLEWRNLEVWSYFCCNRVNNTNFLFPICRPDYSFRFILALGYHFLA